MYDEQSNEHGAGDSAHAEPAGNPPSKKQQVAPKPDFQCSYCGQMFVRAQSNSLPFCSSRCKQIDLGMWLTESYGLPYEGDELDAFRRRQAQDEADAREDEDE